MARSRGGMPRTQHHACIARQARSRASTSGWARMASASAGARSLPFAAAWAALLQRRAPASSHSSGSLDSWMGADSTIHQSANPGKIRESVALEVGDALLDVGGDAFLGVLAGEQLGLQL